MYLHVYNYDYFNILYQLWHCRIYFERKMLTRNEECWKGNLLLESPAVKGFNKHYRQTSNIRRNKSQNLNVSRHIFQLSLLNLLKSSHMLCREWRCNWSSIDRWCWNHQLLIYSPYKRQSINVSFVHILNKLFNKQSIYLLFEASCDVIVMALHL